MVYCGHGLAPPIRPSFQSIAELALGFTGPSQIVLSASVFNFTAAITTFSGSGNFCMTLETA